MERKTRALTTRRRRTVAVTEADAERLTCLLQTHANRLNGPRNLLTLQKKLDEAEVLTSRSVPKDVVTMNSTVSLRNLESGEEVVRTLTFPFGADAAQGRVSILTSVGVAMLGHRKGDVVVCDTRDGATRFRIEKVLYQPEAAHDDDR